jgi:hypothetical protein
VNTSKWGKWYAVFRKCVVGLLIRLCEVQEIFGYISTKPFVSL